MTVNPGQRKTIVCIGKDGVSRKFYREVDHNRDEVKGFTLRFYDHPHRHGEFLKRVSFIATIANCRSL